LWFLSTRLRSRYERDSVYFPIAVHFAVRTGWAPGHPYLFMDVGPQRASLGKEDRLGIFLGVDRKLLLTKGGRSAYRDLVTLSYTVSSYAPNTVVVGGLNQAMTARRLLPCC
jgi:hypothetical protein